MGNSYYFRSWHSIEKLVSSSSDSFPVVFRLKSVSRVVVRFYSWSLDSFPIVFRLKSVSRVVVRFYSWSLDNFPIVFRLKSVSRVVVRFYTWSLDSFVNFLHQIASDLGVPRKYFSDVIFWFWRCHWRLDDFRHVVSWIELCWAQRRGRGGRSQGAPRFHVVLERRFAP